MAKAKLTYKDMTIEDIIAWCTANDKVAWLKMTASRQVPCTVYPRKKVVKLDENGNPMVNPKTGKVKYVSVADKDAEPTTEYRPISFIQIKNEFVEAFMPELKPNKKAKQPSMYDIISEL